MSAKSIQAIIERFEVTEKLGVHTGRIRKSVTSALVDVKTIVAAQSQMSLFVGSIVHMQFLDRQAVLTTPSGKYSET